VANKNYYGKDSLGNQLPFLDTVKITYIDNKQKELEEWEKGNLDFMWGLNPDAKRKFVIEHIQNFKNPPVYEIDSKGELGVQFYEFNTTRKPFNDKRVRQAFSYAVNRNSIVDNVLGGEAYAGLNGITPPALNGYKTSSLKGYKDSVAYAKQLLADAGYPDGKGFPEVTLVINASPTAGESRNSLVAIEIQNQLKQNLGVNVTISRVTFAQKQDAQKYGRADMFRSAWIADYPSPESFLSLFYGRTVPDSTDKPSYPNSSRWRNAKFDSLYDAGVRASSKEEANRLFLQAEQIMLDEAPAMILCYDGNDKLTYSYVHNFYLNPMRYFDFSQVYIKHDDKAGKDSAKKEDK
jgi:peptide/nickel transport system substrate-binding protein